MIGSHDDERTFTVMVDELLGHLKENRAKHLEIVEEAQTKFRERAIEELDRMLRDAKNGKPIRLSASLPVPTQHVDAYDNAILTLEMTKRAGIDKVDVTADEIERFVRNRWRWSRDVSCSNAHYTNKVS